MATRTTSDGSELGSFTREVLAWDGSEDQALRLRQSARELSRLNVKPTCADEQAVSTVLSAYRKKSPGSRHPIDPDRFRKDELKLRAVSPFLGDPALGPWPYEDVFRIPGEQAVEWLVLLRPHALVDDGMLRFVRVMFRARPRTLWVPASETLAAFALRHLGSREYVTTNWEKAFPSGLPESWPGGKKGEKTRGTLSNVIGTDSHLPRHVLHTACCITATTGKVHWFGGRPVTDLPRMALPSSDAADVSAVLLGILALVKADATRSECLPWIPARAAESPIDEQCDQALREIADALRAYEPTEPAVTGLAAVEERLRAPAWQECAGMKRLDTLFSWLDTAVWFDLVQRSDAVAQMEKSSPEAVPALRLRVRGEWLDGQNRMVDAVIDRLRILLDEDIRATYSAECRIICLAELLLLFETDAVRELPWLSLVARAIGRDRLPDLQEGTVEEVGVADLILHALGPNELPAILLRDREFPTHVVLHLVGTKNGFVARQMALQLERLLRVDDAGHPVDCDGQVRLLWKVLQNHPHDESFSQLETMLRSDEGAPHPLSQVIKPIQVLDEIRQEERKGKAQPLHVIVQGYLKLANTAGRLLSPSSTQPNGKSRQETRDERQRGSASALKRVAEDLRQTEELLRTDGPWEPTDTWLKAMRKLLIGPKDQETERGLDEWLEWVAGDEAGSKPTDDKLKRVWGEFEESVTALREASPAVVETQCEDLVRTMSMMREAWQGLAWPEARIFDGSMQRVENWLSTQRLLARRSRQMSEEVDRLLAARNEKKIRDLIKNDSRLELLGPSALSLIGGFLLDQLLFRDAHQFRNRVKKRAVVPSIWSVLGPLFVTVAGGTFLVLDIGTAWDDLLINPDLQTQRRVFLAGTVLLAFGAVTGSLAARMASGASILRRLMQSCYRVSVGFLAAWLVAFLVSLSVLWTLAGTRLMDAAHGISLPYHALFWSGPALFLGIFINLLFQGKRLGRED